MQQRMRRSEFTIGLMSIGLFVAVAMTASLAQADPPYGPPGQAKHQPHGPYYAEPAWDQKLASNNRFIVLEDWNSEAVLDLETGLVWERSPANSTTFTTWSAARLGCINKNVGGRKGWRLPSIPELASLIDPSVASPGPTLPLGHPFLNVQSGASEGYWSASTDAAIPALAWAARFFNGTVFTDAKVDGGQFWCVRGGMNADAY
jgi:hypothetical protein